MASVSDNALFLYHCIVQSQPKLDWNLIGAGLQLKPGTASMRWQRLKPKLEHLTTGAIPASATIDEATLFLHQIILHSSCKIDFNAVGTVTGLKTGTASMRFRRLQDKIKQQHPEVLQANEAPKAKATSKISQTPKSTTSIKRKIKEPGSILEDDDDNEDHSAKKLKLKDESTPSKRQTRGKVQDYKHLLGDSSSAGASSMASMSSGSLFGTTASTTSVDHETTKDEIEEDGPGVSHAGARTITTAKAPGRNSKKTSLLVQSQQGSRQSEMTRSTTAETEKPEEYAMASDQTRVSESSMVEEYEDVEDGLSSLDPGMLLLRKRMATPDSLDIKSEVATVDGPTSPRGNSSSHTSELLQVAINRAASLSPEDSISSVGLVVKVKSEQVVPAPECEEDS